MDHGDFHELFADLHGGVQTCHRLLINHGNFGTTDVTQTFWRHRVQLFAFELDRAANDTAVHAQILHDAKRHCGFTTPRFAHDSKGFAGHNGGGKVHHGGDFAQACEERNGEFVDL